MEIWRDVPGYEGKYFVSTLGRVKGPRGPMRGAPNKKGYRQVSLWTVGHGRVLRMIHRLVLEAFVGPCPEGHECDHRNAIKDDNRLDNLHWVTPKQNSEAAHGLGLIPLGEDHFSAVLNWPQVRLIRAEYKPRTRGAGIYSLGKRYGVHPNTIDAVLKRRTWKFDPQEAA